MLYHWATGTFSGEIGQFKILSESRKYFSIEKLHTYYITFNAPEREEIVRKQQRKQEVFQGLCVNDSKKQHSKIMTTIFTEFTLMTTNDFSSLIWNGLTCSRLCKAWKRLRERAGHKYLNRYYIKNDLIALETNVLKFSFKGTFQGYFLQRFAINSAILQALKTLCSIHPQ